SDLQIQPRTGDRSGARFEVSAFEGGSGLRILVGANVGDHVGLRPLHVHGAVLRHLATSAEDSGGGSAVSLVGGVRSVLVVALCVRSRALAVIVSPSPGP